MIYDIDHTSPDFKLQVCNAWSVGLFPADRITRGSYFYLILSQLMK